MTTALRIYNITRIDDPSPPRLVRAGNQAQALRHVATDTLRCKVASQDELVQLVQAGIEVEDSAATQTAHSDD